MQEREREREGTRENRTIQQRGEGGRIERMHEETRRVVKGGQQVEEEGEEDEGRREESEIAERG